MKDKIFVNGMIIKRPSESAPEYVKANISVKIDDFIRFMREHNNNGWTNIDLKKSREGKLYLELNTFKPNREKDKRDIMFEDDSALGIIPPRRYNYEESKEEED